MSNDKIIINQEDGIVELKMNFSKDNNLNYEAFVLIRETIENSKSNKDIRVMIMGSAVEGFFSNGLDPLMFLDKSEADLKKAAEVIVTSAGAFYFYPWPTITAINGFCMGAGSVLAISADYRLMGEKCRFSFPEGLIAMNFPAFSAKVLQDLVGPAKARDILYFAKALKSPEALDIGLVDELHPLDVLEKKSWDLARKLIRKPKESLTGMKQSLRKSNESLAKELQAWDIEQMVLTLKSKNTQEGFRSILEGRRPKFQ